MFKKILIVSVLLILSIGIVSASDDIAADNNITSQDIAEIQSIDEVDDNISESLEAVDDSPIPENTKIEAKDVKTYYKENSELVAYLKDSNNQPIANKKVSILIDNKNYDKVTDKLGKVILKLNLKPGTYTARINFAGDGDYGASSTNAAVKVNKATLSISTKNYKTYFESGFYFKAKVINKVTKKPVEGVKVGFKVYKNNKHKIYWATTDSKGVAKLKKNLKVGTYKVVTFIKKNKNLKAKKSKAKLTIKETAEMGCSSLYLQVSNYESVAGFRRDATNGKLIKIVKFKLQGRTAIKQYKSNSYFFHLVTTADGWMFGTGGIDNPDVNRGIEKLAGKIIKSGKIKKSDLRKIQRYEQQLSLGHFSIKAPNGKYGLVWAGSIWTGKLKPGEYICVPNGQSSYRHGDWDQFSKNPAKAAIKVAATDSYGINRRDITAFHWKATTKEGKTTSTLKVYAANDKGQLSGRSTGYLMDDIKFKGKFFSKYDLPKAPSKLLLGVQKFGSIDKLIKTQTKVKAPKLTKLRNQSKTFDITVKDKKTKKPIKNLKLKLKIGKKVYTIKTNKKGVAKFNTKSLKPGSYTVVIYSGNDKYFVSAKSKITIKQVKAKTNSTSTI
jgi:5-hydroxyisourate hydrolase-like protein (transthyretin family)